jgi:catechol 2,3-dioxygenase-like lactoylglutathione lyase family enzyme
MSSEQEEGPLPRWPNWLGIVVEDLEEQRRFYRNVLGIAEVDVGEDRVQFDMGGPNLFELLRRNDRPRYDRLRFRPASRSATSTPIVRA